MRTIAGHADHAVAFGFPFAVSAAGRIEPAPDGDAVLRSRVLQVLFTAPGERVGLPEFGCGLLNLVFDTSDPVLAAAVEFTVGQALTRWLGDQLVVDAVSVDTRGEVLDVDVVYTSRADRTRRSIRFLVP